jgi:mannose-6-phosphate isomerase-like protein (cupin superfamily)
MGVSEATATVIAAGAGEVLGDAPDRRVELLCDHDALHVTWSRFGPGRDGADLHVHRHHTDLFYVLAGELTVRLGPDGAPRVLTSGTLARVPALVVHGFRNASAEEVRYLNLHAPGRGFAGFMRGLRDGRPVAYDQHEPPADGGRSPDDVDVVPPEPDGPAVRPLARDAHLAATELRGAPGERLDLPGGAAALAALFVLDGELAIGERRAAAGAWVTLPAGADAAVSVRGPASARALHVSAPAPRRARRGGASAIA